MKTKNQHLDKRNALPCVQTPVSGSRFVPMLFSTDMVKAILNGSKTETRRANGLQKINLNPSKWLCKQFKHLFVFTDVISSNEISIVSNLKIDDIIWVRETFQNECEEIQLAGGNWSNSYLNSTGKYIYKADDLELPKDSIAFGKWKPSLFMPKSAARIFLKVISVSIERLHDIDEQSAINEGVQNMLSNADLDVSVYKNYFCTKKEIDSEINNGNSNSAKHSYQTLWQKINGKDSWDFNPFVWVYKFQRIDEPHGFR